MPVLQQAILREAPLSAEAVDIEVEEAVREHARSVYRIAYAVLRNHHDAEDATQETFIRFLRHRKRWAGVRDRRAWLARVAWRVAIDRKRRLPEIPLDQAAEIVLGLRAAGASADEIAAHQQMAALLERLIATLPRELRETLTLSSVDELSSPEIAELLGIAEGSVRTRLLRARQILKEKLSVLLEGKHGPKGTPSVC
jgi:RNA polymerase sigma-70 factor (ECF subfamily)